MFRKQLLIVGRRALRHMSTEAESSAKGGKMVMSGERSFNKATLLGRCGRNPEMRGTVEHPVTIFPLATSISIRKTDGTYEQRTEWHKIVVFRPVLRDKVASFISGGDRVFVSGSINYSTYESDGQTKNSTSIIADEVINCSPRKPAAATEDSV